jgi:hypothetical protein
LALRVSVTVFGPGSVSLTSRFSESNPLDQTLARGSVTEVLLPLASPPDEPVRS